VARRSANSRASTGARHARVPFGGMRGGDRRPGRWRRLGRGGCPMTSEWSTRRWVAAAVTAVVFTVVVASPPDMIDTPLFSRDIPVTWWAWPSLIITSVLAGLLLA